MYKINTEKKICIVGIGGCGRDVLCCLADCIANTGLELNEVACFMVGDEYFKEEKVMGVDVIPLSKFNPELYNVVVAIGNPNDRRAFMRTLPSNTTYTSIIHPGAIISNWVEIGAGSVIAAGTIITCNIKIGRHAQLNINTTICHDCITGDFFTTAPAVNVSGNCQFGDQVYLGTNACVKEKIKICSNVTIGMGAVVVKDILEEGTYVGNPAVKLKRIQN